MSGGAPVPQLLATQNYSAILRPLQWLVIALIFLFFLRVVRAVWVEVRPAGPRQTRRERRAQEEPPPPVVRSRRRRRQLYLEVVEPPEHQGEVYDPRDELTIGRSPGNGVPTSYDVYSSTMHARVFREHEKLWVEDLGSTNGTFVNSERLAKPVRLGRGDLVQVGATVFEVTR